MARTSLVSPRAAAAHSTPSSSGGNDFAALACFIRVCRLGAEAGRAMGAGAPAALASGSQRARSRALPSRDMEAVSGRPDIAARERVPSDGAAVRGAAAQPSGEADMFGYKFTSLANTQALREL